MKENLVPTVINDKNGKTTTVYRKPVHGSESSGAIPAPTVASTPRMERSAAVDMIANAVAKSYNFDDDNRDTNVRATLGQYPDALLHRLVEHFSSYSHGNYFTASSIDEGDTPAFVSEMMVYSPYFQTDSKELANSLVRSLHHYKQLPAMDDYGVAPKDVQEKCMAILTVTEMIDNHQYYNDAKDVLPLKYFLGETNSAFQGYTRIAGDNLIDLVLEKTEQAERIAEIIIERETGDASLIREILSQDDSKALNSGVL